MTNPTTKGLGSCLAPTESGKVCGRQIEDGEPIRTVIVAGKPVVAHAGCAEGFSTMAKRISQEGPGGPVDFSKAVPLVKEGSPDIPEFKSGRSPAPPPVADPPLPLRTLRSEIESLLKTDTPWPDHDPFGLYVMKCLSTYTAWEKGQ